MLKEPQEVASLRDCGVVVAGLSVGSHHSLAIDSDGRLWAWGLGESGQLGHGNDQVRRPLRPF